MIAVISSPSESQLGKVAGADDNAAEPIGQIHENLGPLSGLGIFVGDVMHMDIVSDISKMGLHRLGDADFMEGRAKALNQSHSVVVGAVSGAETGHGHRVNLLSGNVKPVASCGADQKGQGGIQSAGNADNHWRCSDFFQSGHQTHGLNIENFFAVGNAGFLVRRHKGSGVYRTNPIVCVLSVKINDAASRSS